MRQDPRFQIRALAAAAMLALVLPATAQLSSATVRGSGGGPGNSQNYLGGDNGHLGVPGSISGPMRMVKLSMRYAF